MLDNPQFETSLRAALAAGSDGPSSDFDLNPEFAPKDVTLRDAAVLVPIQMVAGTPHVILTKRAAGLKHHPGQVAFAGGKVDASDAGPLAAALREADEEIGLPQGAVNVVGTLPQHQTVTNFLVTPFVAFVDTAFTPKIEIGEVDEAFYVPLSHLADPARYQVHARQWRGQGRAYFTVPYGPYYIWGATARILRLFAGVLEGLDAD